jgi:hypothetical protein
MVAGMDALACENILTRPGKSAAPFHRRAICKTAHGAAEPNYNA